jgi:prepilin-type N-terminal cleavage/methylation domain-containing protein
VKQVRAGFTLVEVLVAVVVLGIGIVALAGSAAMVTRMVGRGQMGTRAAQLASRRLEFLRNAAYKTNPRCTDASFARGGPVTAQGVTETWVIAAGLQATITETVTYRAATGGTHSDVFTTRIGC